MDGGLFLCYGYKVEYDEAVPWLEFRTYHNLYPADTGAVSTESVQGTLFKIPKGVYLYGRIRKSESFQLQR